MHARHPSGPSLFQVSLGRYTAAEDAAKAYDAACALLGRRTTAMNFPRKVPDVTCITSETAYRRLISAEFQAYREKNCIKQGGTTSHMIFPNVAGAATHPKMLKPLPHADASGGSATGSESENNDQNDGGGVSISRGHSPSKQGGDCGVCEISFKGKKGSTTATPPPRKQQEHRRNVPGRLPPAQLFPKAERIHVGDGNAAAIPPALVACGEGAFGFPTQSNRDARSIPLHLPVFDPASMRFCLPGALTVQSLQTAAFDSSNLGMLLTLASDALEEERTGKDGTRPRTKRKRVSDEDGGEHGGEEDADDVADELDSSVRYNETREHTAATASHVIPPGAVSLETALDDATKVKQARLALAAAVDASATASARAHAYAQSTAVSAHDETAVDDNGLCQSLLDVLEQQQQLIQLILPMVRQGARNPKQHA